jgi:hypothetical protein
LPGFQAIQQSDLRRDLTYISSDELGGRMSHNIPAVWWFTGFHPDYHHTTDAVDKIDFSKVQKILEPAYLTAWQLGTEPTPPRFVANPSDASGAGSKRLSYRYVFRNRICFFLLSSRPS